MAAGHGEEGGDPRLCLGAAEVREVDALLRTAVKPAVWLVERIHDEAARVDDATDVPQGPGEFAVVAEEHYRGGFEKGAQRFKGLEYFGLGDAKGAER